MSNKKPFQGFDHGTGIIKLEGLYRPVGMLPTEIHLKRDGSKKDEPSFCIVMKGDGQNITDAYGQITLEMLNNGLSDIGYKVVKTEIDSKTITENEKKERGTIYTCGKCGNNSFRVYSEIIIDDAHLYCSKCNAEL